MENTESGEKTKPPVEAPERPNRFVSYIKRKLQDRKAKKDKENPTDRAVRVTATATLWMAIFTFVLAFVGIVTLIEIIEGGQDTHELAVAAGKQADRMKDLADRMKDQAGATHDLAVAAGKQADASKALADLTAKQFTASQRLIESQRASITVAFASVLNPVTFHNGALSFAFAVTLKNNGRLPANKVKVRYKPYFSQWGKNIFSEPMERQRDYCSKPDVSRDSRTALKGLTSEDALTILSGDTKEWQINFGMGAPTDSDIIEWPPPESKLPQTRRVYPIVIGCVDYQSGVMTEAHQTGFIFEIKRGDPRMPSFITLGEDVRREDARVEQYFFGQGKSY